MSKGAQQDICLVNPPSPFLADDKACPPLGLLYLAAALEAEGHSVRVLDLASRPDWEERAREVSEPIVGVTSVTPNYPFARRIIELLPKSAFTLIGGPHPSSLPERTKRETQVDCLVAGEAEVVLPQLVSDLKAGKSVGPIIEAGQIPIERVRRPARHLIELADYSPEMAGGPSTTVLSSRGCPFACRFCYKDLTGRIVRYHDVDFVIAELEEIVEIYGYRRIVFADDNFATNKKRLCAICDFLADRRVEWRAIARVDCVDRPTLAMMRDSGCVEISFGVESGAQRMLDLMNKQTSVETLANGILLAKAVGLTTKAFFVVGFPGETDQSIEETKRFFADTLPDKWLLSTFSPLPGTDVWRHPERYGITYLDEDFGNYWLVGEGGDGGLSFETQDLFRSKVKEMHDDLYGYFQSLVPMRRAHKEESLWQKCS